MKIISGTLLLIVLGLSLMFYSMRKSEIEDLILCSTKNESHYIPQIVCKTYLFEYRGTEKDIQSLESRSGLSFIFGLTNEKEKEALFQFLISKKININKISPIDGFTPLHAAVLEKNYRLIKALLSNGADKTIVSPSTKRTAIELARKMQKNDEEGYGKIIALLNET